MDMGSTVAQVAKSFQLHEVGVCRYDPIKRPLLSCRAISRLPKGARSVIVVLFPYAFDEDTPRNISRYACVADYHTAAGNVLCAMAQALHEVFPNDRFEPFIDNSPLPEVACAVAAGLGVRGDNGLFISDTYGSYVFIGCVVTTLDMVCGEQHRECLHCGACARCCPGGCLPGTSRDTCVSAISQKKGELTSLEQQRLLQSGSLWGCDACQDACPMNKNKHIQPHPCFSWYEPRLTLDSLEALDGKAYAWRGDKVLRRNLALFDSDT